jgi:hypothetical protein
MWIGWVRSEILEEFIWLALTENDEYSPINRG